MPKQCVRQSGTGDLKQQCMLIAIYYPFPFYIIIYSHILSFFFQASMALGHLSPY